MAELIGWVIFFIIALIINIVLFPYYLQMLFKDDTEEERMRILQRNKRLKYLNKRKLKENLKYQAKTYISPANEFEVNKDVDLDAISSQTTSEDIDLVKTYLKDIGRVPSLSHEQEINLGRQVQEYMQVERVELELIELTGNQPNIEKVSKKLDLSPSQIDKIKIEGQRAKEKMVAANQRLVVSLAKKYTNRNVELLDLIQEGTIGLVRAVEKFDPARGYKFSEYAYWWIREGIAKAITEKTGKDLPDKQMEMDYMRGVLNQLPYLQRRVLKMRYGMDGNEPMSLVEIGRLLEISRDRVRNLERDGLRGLRRLGDNVSENFPE